MLACIYLNLSKELAVAGKLGECLFFNGIITNIGPLPKVSQLLHSLYGDPLLPYLILYTTYSNSIPIHTILMMAVDLMIKSQENTGIMETVAVKHVPAIHAVVKATVPLESLNNLF